MLLFLCCPLSASNYLSYASFHVRFGCPLLFRDRQEKNGGVKGIDGRAEELDRETGEEQITVGRTRRKDGG